MRLAFWNETIWKDKGHGTFSGTAVSGKMTSAEPVSTYGYFTLATNAAIALTCPVSPPFPFGGLTSSYVIANFGAASTGVLTTNQNILIDGTFTIDQDFTFLNCPNIKMAADAKIIVNANFTLNIYLSRIRNCDNYQWDYIKITGSNAMLNVSQSTIQGADTAIWSDGGGVYHVVGRSSINRCWKGIMVDTYTSAGFNGTIQDTWIGCATLAGGTTTATLFPPHTSKRTNKGIHVLDVNTITFGFANTNGLDVNFFNMDRGIYTSNTSLNVYNCNFDKIDNGGIGIHSVRQSGTRTLTVGNSVPGACRFLRCSEGIRTNAMNVTIYSNFFDYTEDYGIHVVRCQHRTIDITGNEFNRFGIGTGIYNCLDANVRVVSNNFNAPGQVFLPVDLINYGNTAVDIFNNTLELTDVNVNGNYITNTVIGVKLKLIDNIFLGIGLFGTIVNGNHIYFPIEFTDLQSTGSRHYGIMLAECNWGEVAGNVIERPTTNTQPVSGDEWYLMTGIYFERVDFSMIANNALTYISSGVNFRVTDMFSTIVCNNFTECYTGADLGKVPQGGPANNVVTMNHQVGSGGRTQNHWHANSTNPAYTNRVYGRVSSPINWYRTANINITNPYYPENSEPASFNNVVIPTSVITVACPNDQWEPLNRDTLISGIVLDTLVHTDHQRERKYMLLQSAYRMLDDDTNLLHINANDSVYIAFYNTHKASNIGKYRKVEKLINAENYAAAADSLSHITDTNTMESYRKTVLEIYLNTFAVEDTMDASDSADLAEIAYDCVIYGGRAVHEARTMLGIDVIDSCSAVEEEERLAINALNIKSVTGNSKNYLKLQPNPAHDYLVANYYVDDPQALLMKIMDISGRVAKTIQLPATRNSIMISTDGLQQGLYFYTITNNDKINMVGKFVIE